MMIKQITHSTMTASSASLPSSSRPRHILFFPYPSSGHLIPLLDLAHRLLLLDPSLTLTFLLTPPHHNTLTLPSNIKTLLLTPPPPTSTFSLIGKIRALKELTGPIKDWYKKEMEVFSHLVMVMISDFFLGWTKDLAEDLGIPRLTFCPSGAFGTAEFYTLWRDAPENPNPEDSGFGVRFRGIPGEPVIPWWQVSHVYRGLEGKGEKGREDWEFFRDCVRKNMKSDATIINSFDGFEGAYVEYLKNEMGNEKVWAVGPLLPLEEEEDLKRGGENSVPAEEVLEWMDQRKERSVLYVCFGSRASLSGDQIRALTAALESSKVDFVWAFRESDRANAGTMPEGFEDRVAGRGHVIRGWAPQLAILRHSSTAAFLTHCGWNSVLESVAVGVMMVGWPQGADQFVDARLIEEVGAGVRVKVSGPENVPDPEELARLLKETVGEDRPERVRVKELQVAAKEAVKEGGCSYMNLEQLVSYLRQPKN